MNLISYRKSNFYRILNNLILDSSSILINDFTFALVSNLGSWDQGSFCWAAKREKARMDGRKNSGLAARPPFVEICPTEAIPIWGFRLLP